MVGMPSGGAIYNYISLGYCPRYCPGSTNKGSKIFSWAQNANSTSPISQYCKYLFHHSQKISILACITFFLYPYPGDYSLPLTSSKVPSSSASLFQGPQGVMPTIVGGEGRANPHCLTFPLLQGFEELFSTHLVTSGIGQETSVTEGLRVRGLCHALPVLHHISAAPQTLLIFKL